MIDTIRAIYRESSETMSDRAMTVEAALIVAAIPLFIATVAILLEMMP